MRHEFSREDYLAYLKSEIWKSLSSRCKERDGFRCRVCNSNRNLEAHHRTYERIFCEELGDLTTLCEQCHDIFTEAGALKQLRLKSESSGEVEPLDSDAKELAKAKVRRAAHVKRVFDENGPEKAKKILNKWLREEIERLKKYEWK